MAYSVYIDYKIAGLIKRFMEDHPELGINTVDEFIDQALTRYLQDIQENLT